MFALITDAVDNLGAFGFVNVEDACLTTVVYAGAVCKSPDCYLFWDGIHPTKMGHELLADAVLAALPYKSRPDVIKRPAAKRSRLGH